MSIDEAKELLSYHSGRNTNVDKYIVSNIVGITHLARTWASPDGMPGSNNLLTEEQIN